MKQTKSERSELKRLVDKYEGKPGLSWGPARKSRGMHVAIHRGESSAGTWAGLTFSQKESVDFADNFVRSLINGENLPAIRALIDKETRALRAEVTSLRCALLNQSPIPSFANPVRPYSDGTALVLVRKGGAA
jgi:hypothetical protein